MFGDGLLTGSLEKHAETSRVQRGASEVGSILLAELDQWRRSLAQDIATRNPSLTSRRLNAAVQETIDRIVFFRIAEARDRYTSNFSAR